MKTKFNSQSTTTAAAVMRKKGATVRSSSPTTRLRLEFKEVVEEESGMVEETVLENCHQITPLLGRDVHQDETCRCLDRI